MDRKKKLRRATEKRAQLKRAGAEEMAQEFPEGSYNAPPIESDRKERNVRSTREKQQE